ADHKSTHDVMAESLEIIRKAWSEPTLAYSGKFFQIPEVIVNPKPMQNPPPPFYMATSSLDGVEVGARLGINMFLPIHTRSPEQLIEYADAYWSGLKQHGHDPQQKGVVSLVPMREATGPANARRRAELVAGSACKDTSYLRRGSPAGRNRG